MTGQRKQQVESTLQRAIGQVVLRHLSDPRLRGILSITRVTVSPGFHDAFVYVSVLPEQYQQRSLAALQHASGYIHGLLHKALALKNVPRLQFRLDQTLKNQARVLGDIATAMGGEPGSREDASEVGPDT